MKICKCGEVVQNYRSKYCSNKCQQQSEYEEYIQRWKAGLETGNRNKGRNLIVTAAVKRYLREKFGNACTRCGWCQKNPTTEEVPLQAEHLNGNAADSSEENLDLICPNCHSLTPTFGGLNRGSGRSK